MPLSCNPPISNQQKALLTCEAFWSFSLSHYNQEGLQQGILTLQDKHHGNVNLALLLIWLDSLSIGFPAPHIKTLETALISTDPLLFSYRKLRKAIKQTANTSLYQDALNFELQLEQQQQADLIKALLGIQLKQLTTIDAPALLRQYCLSLNAETLMFNLQAN
ncbi:TIGR02444 family protein [Aliivibrio sp. S3MY1]|uniref:TIGR02444 family protein n=1 Tax=unclassified Aliivibrio TaxID=2645654 RepID=UPI002379F471|nr:MULTISPECIES: TIGR02444 family protein [unclassified Aliivibrio]MDD9197381.1 TIGR02444 family protein [Aliivibrio sp. S3MY1]MDD9199765.1 TIGR02444 family protein [Aliivibrio sp. S2MY1]